MTVVAKPAGTTVPGPAALLSSVLDELMEGLGAADNVDELAAARKSFDDRRGRVFEDEELWEPWTQAFLEWFALERQTERGAPPPAVRLLADATGARAEVLRALCTSHRSLFEVVELRPGAVELRDLLGGGSFEVAEPRALHGVSAGDVAELRVVGLGGEVRFGRTFCYHPAGTRDAIIMHARRIRGEGGDRREVIDFCSSLRVRCERYKHVSAVKVYQAARGTER